MSKMPWFRFYSEFRSDTKLKRMPVHHRYAFVILLCLASEDRNRGSITGLDDEDVAFELEMELEDWQTLKAKFRVKGFIEIIDGGIKIASWESRQYDSPSAHPAEVAKRVRKHRAKKRQNPIHKSNPSLTSVTSETSLKRACNESETEVKRESNDPETKCNARDTDPDTDPDTDQKKTDLSPSVERSLSAKPDEKKSKRLDYEKIREVYNAARGPSWQKCDSVRNPRRQKMIKAASGDRTTEQICQLIEQAALAMRFDGFWARTDSSFSIDTLFRQGRIDELAEKANAFQEIPAIEHELRLRASESQYTPDETTAFVLDGLARELGIEEKILRAAIIFEERKNGHGHPMETATMGNARRTLSTDLDW